MVASEILSLIEDGTLTELKNSDIKSNGQYLSIRDWVVFPIKHCNSSLDQTDEIDVLKSDKQLLGVLVFCRQLDPKTLTSLTEKQLICYLSDTSADDFAARQPFKYDYILIKTENFEIYNTVYKQGVELWGGFTHQDFIHNKYRLSSSIQAHPVNITTVPFQKNTLLNSVVSSDSFERFLRLYHQLELMFDWITVKEIKALPDYDIHGFSNVLSAYSSTDVNRLTHLITEYCDKPLEIEEQIKLLAPYLSLAEQIFQTHTKQGNPLDAEKWTKFRRLVASGQISEAIFLQNKLAKERAQYELLLKKMVAYWIFRVRCSIAHSKIGEYILERTDEEFIFYFAEPLVRSAVIQIFNNPKFINLCVPLADA